MSPRLARMAAAALLGAAVVATSSGRAEGIGFKGRLEVRVLEIGYAPAARSLRMRIHPAARAVLTPELKTTDPETIDRLLRLAEMKSHGARLDVEIEEGEIRAVDVSIEGLPLSSMGR